MKDYDKISPFVMSSTCKDCAIYNECLVSDINLCADEKNGSYEADLWLDYVSDDYCIDDFILEEL